MTKLLANHAGLHFLHQCAVLSNVVIHSHQPVSQVAAFRLLLDLSFNIDLTLIILALYQTPVLQYLHFSFHSASMILNSKHKAHIHDTARYCLLAGINHVIQKT
jgi:hypothetical protein